MASESSSTQSTPSLKPNGVLNAPADLETMRQKLFELESPITFATRAEYDSYWRFVDNFWTRNQTNKASDRRTEYWLCRFHRKIEPRSKSSTGQRSKATRQAYGCGMKLRIVIYQDGIVEITRMGQCRSHNHSLREMDMVKRNSGVRVASGVEMHKGYGAAQVLQNLQKNNELAAAGGQFLTLMNIRNTSTSLGKTSTLSHITEAKKPWERQATQACAELEGMGYQALQISAKRQRDGIQSEGLVFALPSRLRKLIERGFLTIMDSTHDTNRLGWFLFTLVVRDEYSSFVPAAHILTSREDSDIVAEGLRTIRAWCGDRWLVRYFLTDDSAGEQSAVVKAFSDLPPDHPLSAPPLHLLCRVHSERTLTRRLTGDANKEAREHLITALKVRQTREGCLDSINKAIAAAPESLRSYITKEWLNTMEYWANYTRTRNCLLLQVTSTNSVESWHAALKLNKKAELPKYSLEKLCSHIDFVAKRWDTIAEKREFDFRTRFVTRIGDIPQLRAFPYPVQQLVVKELDKLEDDEEHRITVEPPQNDGPLSCTCIFWRRYQLPCCHILKQHRLWGVITERQWEDWAWMWRDSNFEMYETATKTYATNELYEQIGAPLRQRTEVRTVLEGLMGAFYRLEADLDALGLDPDDRNVMMNGWIESLHKHAGQVRRLAVDQLVQQIELESPRVAEAVRESQYGEGLDAEDLRGVAPV